MHSAVSEMIAAEGEYESTAQDLYLLREWLKKMPHIVQDYDDAFLTTFIKGCKGSLQKTKIILEKFNSLGLCYPDFFGHLDINNQTTRECLKETMFFPMPNRLDDGAYVLIITTDFKDSSASKKQHLFEFWRYWLMGFIIRAWENDGGRSVTIIDWKNITLSNAKEMTPVLVRAMVDTLKSLPLRLQAVYLINISPALEWVFTLMKSLSRDKFGDRFHFISSIDTLHKMVPKEFLPKDYGGFEDDIKTLHNRYMKKVKSYRDRLVEENRKMRNLDPLRPKDKDSILTLGTFKSLNVD